MRSPSENGAVSPPVISTVTLTLSIVLKFLVLSQHVPGLGWLLSPPMSPMPSSYSLGLCPYLGHLKGYLHLRGHGVGWELSKSLLAFICGCSSVPREVVEELNLESSPLRPGVVALTAKLKSSPSLISVPRNLSWMRCSHPASQGV